MQIVRSDVESSKIHDVYREIISHPAIAPVREKLNAAVQAATWHFEFDAAATPKMRSLLLKVLHDPLIRAFVSDAFTVADYGFAMFEVDWGRTAGRYEVRLEWRSPDLFEPFDDGGRFEGIRRIVPAGTELIRATRSIWLAMPRPGEPESAVTLGCGLAEQALDLWRRHQASGDSEADLRSAYLGCHDEVEGMAIAAGRILRACARGINLVVGSVLRLTFGDEAIGWATLSPEIPVSSQPKAPADHAGGNADQFADGPTFSKVCGRWGWSRKQHKLSRLLDAGTIKANHRGKGMRLDPAGVLRYEQDHPEVLNAGSIGPTSIIREEAAVPAEPKVKRKGTNYVCPECGAATKARFCKNCPHINSKDFIDVR